MSDLPLPLDDPGYVMIPQYDHEPEPVVDVPRQAKSRLSTFPLVRVRAGISLELPAAFPAVEYQGTKLDAA
jgi:hypothetical protein